LIIVGVSVANNFQTLSNKTELLTEYECVTQEVFFGNAMLAISMSGRKYDVILQNGDCSRERSVRILVFRKKSVMKTQRRYRTQYGKAPPADNAIQRWLKQFQETGSVLHREDRALRRKMLIESRKRFLEAHKNRLDQHSAQLILQNYKTLWITFSYSVSSFILLLPV
jgi:hypothetical protein